LIGSISLVSTRPEVSRVHSTSCPAAAAAAAAAVTSFLPLHRQRHQHQQLMQQRAPAHFTRRSAIRCSVIDVRALGSETDCEQVNPAHGTEQKEIAGKTNN